MWGSQGHFRIGGRNYAALHQIFLKNNGLIDKEGVGGLKARTLFLEMASGQAGIKVRGRNTIPL